MKPRKSSDAVLPLCAEEYWTSYRTILVYCIRMKAAYTMLACHMLRPNAVYSSRHEGTGAPFSVYQWSGLASKARAWAQTRVPRMQL